MFSLRIKKIYLELSSMPPLIWSSDDILINSVNNKYIPDQTNSKKSIFKTGWVCQSFADIFLSLHMIL